MWSSNIEQLKAKNTSDAEVAQLVKLKQAGLGDDACVALVAAARERQHPFVSGDSTGNLVAAAYSESQILEIAKVDQLDSISGELVALRLIVLSDSTFEFLLHRPLQRRPTLSSAAIAHVQTTGVTDKQTSDGINTAMTHAHA